MPLIQRKASYSLKKSAKETNKLFQIRLQELRPVKQNTAIVFCNKQTQKLDAPIVDKLFESKT